MAVRPAKTQISLGIRPVWSESSLSAWRKLGSLATHWAQSEDSDQTGWMPRLIWVFAWRTAILLVVSCRDSIIIYSFYEVETSSPCKFQQKDRHTRWRLRFSSAIYPYDWLVSVHIKDLLMGKLCKKEYAGQGQMPKCVCTHYTI